MSPRETPRGAAEPIGAASLAQLRSARRLSTRKGRQTAGEFLAEGPQAVREALAADAVLRLFVTAAARAAHPDLIPPDQAAVIVTPEQLSGLSDTVTPQGIVAVCRLPVASLQQVLATRPNLVVLCAQVRDPGNAGTVIRCADAFGAQGVILSEGSVEVTNPKVVRGSVGSVFHLPLVPDADLAESVAALRAAGLQILAASGNGDADLAKLDESGVLAGPTAWLLGNEAWGLPPEQLALADRVVRIPMWGQAESLNLATAAAVCLYTSAAAQRRSRA